MGDVWREICASPGHLAVALMVAALGVGGLCLATWIGAWAALCGGPAVVLTDIYVIHALWMVARASADMSGADARLPERTTAIVVVFCFAGALATSFAALYLACGGVASAAGPLSSRTDALYFSVVTLTTLGYGDFAPQTATAKWLVMSELGSGILLLVVAVPLVIARISMWKS